MGLWHLRAEVILLAPRFFFEGGCSLEGGEGEVARLQLLELRMYYYGNNQGQTETRENPANFKGMELLEGQ